jgi:hypothetical protein
MNSFNAGQDSESSSQKTPEVPSTSKAIMAPAPALEPKQSEQIRASIDAWLEVAEPVLLELEAASTLTQRDFAVRINSK